MRIASGIFWAREKKAQHFSTLLHKACGRPRRPAHINRRRGSTSLYRQRLTLIRNILRLLFPALYSILDDHESAVASRSHHGGKSVEASLACRLEVQLTRLPAMLFTTMQPSVHRNGHNYQMRDLLSGMLGRKLR